MFEPWVVHGPVVPSTNRIIYQVTLASGMIVTSPEGFGEPLPAVILDVPPPSLVAPLPPEPAQPSQSDA
jgi:hypothetical protein